MYATFISATSEVFCGSCSTRSNIWLTLNESPPRSSLSFTQSRIMVTRVDGSVRGFTNI